MPAFTLELEIDGTAHPELYEMLLAIESPSYRAERLRQLAVTGLILERLRIAPEALPSPAAARPEGNFVGSHLALVLPTLPPRPEARDFPVLHEEVPESLLRRKVEEEPPALLDQPPDAAPDAVVAESTPSAAAPAGTGSPADTAPIVRMPGNRSRLMRMKNRGLFTNE